jgi:hypothetical protein
VSRSWGSAFVLASLCACAAGSPAPSGPGANPSADYEVLSLQQTDKGEVLGVVCRNGTTACNPRWADLCKQGKAVDVDPWGNETSSPGYVHAKDNTPTRIFRCKT